MDCVTLLPEDVPGAMLKENIFIEDHSVFELKRWLEFRSVTKTVTKVDLINRKNITFLNFWKTRRYILSVLACLGYINIYALRANLSVAIVDMTQLKNFTLDDGMVVLKREFDWNSKLQGYVLSSFFYGYVTTQLLGGYIASRIGGVKVFGFGVAVTSFLTVVTPFIAKYNVYLLIAVRAVEGIFEGITMPACNEIWTKWAPPLERTRLITISWSGAYLGAVIAMPISSVLSTSLGWESIFYVFGSLGLAWYLIWLLFARDTPHADTRISAYELKYITESVSSTKAKNDILQIPIYHYITSLPVWAAAIATFTEFWGFYTLFTCLPNFMKNILNFDLNSAGLLSAVPYLAMAIMVNTAGYLGDCLLTKEVFSTTNTRKLFTVFAFLTQAVFLLIGSFWMSPIGTTICLTIAVGFGGFAIAGFGVAIIELAPKYGGITGGYCSTYSALTGVISPILTGYIVTDHTSNYQWRNVFYISASIYIAGAVFFGLFGSSDVQPWGRDDPPDANTETTENKDQVKPVHDNFSA